MTTPDPHTSAKASWYKSEVHALHMGCVDGTSNQEKDILLPKYRDRNGRCITILFKNVGVRGRRSSPEKNEHELFFWLVSF